jgi:hypothetical protein
MAVMKRSRIDGWTVAGFAGATTVLLAVVALRGITSSHGPLEEAGRQPGPIVDVCSGVGTTLSEAESEMPFAVELPHDPLASADSLKQVWQCSETQVAFEYESGVVLYLSEDTLSDPAAVWQKMAEEYPEFSTGIVRGVPASLAEPSKEEGAEGGVDLVEDGVRMTVSGNGVVPLADLVRVAESIQRVGTPARTLTGTGTPQPESSLLLPNGLGGLTARVAGAVCAASGGVPLGILSAPCSNS